MNCHWDPSDPKEAGAARVGFEGVRVDSAQQGSSQAPRPSPGIGHCVPPARRTGDPAHPSPSRGISRGWERRGEGPPSLEVTGWLCDEHRCHWPGDGGSPRAPGAAPGSHTALTQPWVGAAGPACSRRLRGGVGGSALPPAAPCGPPVHVATGPAASGRL